MFAHTFLESLGRLGVGLASGGTALIDFMFFDLGHGKRMSPLTNRDNDGGRKEEESKMANCHVAVETPKACVCVTFELVIDYLFGSGRFLQVGRWTPPHSGPSDRYGFRTD